MIIKNNFHKKGFALGVVLNHLLASSRKWPIWVVVSNQINLFTHFMTKMSKHRHLEKVQKRKFFAEREQSGS